MALVEQTAKVKVDVNDIEVVEGNPPYLKISAPAIVENVRAVRKAAGLEGIGVSVEVSVP